MNNLTASLILAIAIAVVFIVISAVAYKLHLKNKNTRILKKIHNNESCGNHVEGSDDV